MGKKHCGKRRKCWLPAFSPCPTMFSKGFFFVVKGSCLACCHGDPQSIVLQEHDSFSFLNREYVHSVAVYQKYLTKVGRKDNFRALARKLSFFPTELDIFDILQHYVLILFILQRLIC